MFSLILLGLITALALYVRHVYTYWQRRGFPVDESSIPFGCLGTVFKRERSFGMAINDVYQRSSDKFVGIYLTFRPALLVRDAELTRNILVKDFPSFHDRGVYVDVEKDPTSGNLFALQGERWKTLRQKLTPSFTSGKLKGMFGTIDDVGNRMLEHLDRVVPDEGGVVIEMKQLFTTYAVDIIASVIMGLDVDSFKEPENKFRKISEQLNSPTFMSVIRGTVQFLCPPIEKWIVWLGIKDEATESMRDIVRQTVEFREKNNFSRKDMMQLLIQLRNTGKINLDDNIWDVETAADAFKSMSIDTITAQALLFYAAGFDTSASASAFTMYELSQNPELMAKAQADVQQALDKHGGQLTYECIQDMKYLDLCFMETIRKYPGLPILNRECTQDFQIPGTDKVIEKGTPIIISLFGIHRDPEYFPNPMKYDPERFVETNQNYNPLAYMPFGEGPRHCIAQRMGKVNIKVALAKVLTHYNVEALCKSELEIDNFSVVIVPKGGAKVKLIKKKGLAAK